MFKMKEGFAHELLERLRVGQSTPAEVIQELRPYDVILADEAAMWWWIFENG